MGKIGNIVDPEVPISKNEDEDNLIVSLYPTPPEGDNILPANQGKIEYTLPATKPLKHDDLLWRIDGYEPSRGRTVAVIANTFSKMVVFFSTRH